MLIRIVGGHGGVSPGFKATSYLIDGKLLIDAGSCASSMLIPEQKSIDNILISHPHLDHIKDLAFLCDNCFGLRPDPFMVYTNKTIHDAIKKHLLNDYIWPDFTKLPSEENPTMKFSEIEAGKSFNLNGYNILPVSVNHFCDAMGFIVEKDDTAVIFTQDTGPTDEIWEKAKKFKNIKAIFTEVSFPNSLHGLAMESKHHSPQSIKNEIDKMPADVPIFLGHLKPNYSDEIFKEIAEIGNSRLNIMGMDDASYVF